MPNITRTRAFACALVLGLLVVSPAAFWMHTTTALALGIVIVVLAAISAELFCRINDLEDRLALTTVTDAPTGVLTQSAFHAASECASFACVLKVSIDDIEAIAEEYGWETAEEVLGHAANVVCASVREHDPVGRTAQNEFSVLLEDVELEVAQRICHRIEINISSTPYSNGMSIIELSGQADIAKAPDLRRAA